MEVELYGGPLDGARLTFRPDTALPPELIVPIERVRLRPWDIHYRVSPTGELHYDLATGVDGEPRYELRRL